MYCISNCMLLTLVNLQKQLFSTYTITYDVVINYYVNFWLKESIP